MFFSKRALILSAIGFIIFISAVVVATGKYSKLEPKKDSAIMPAIQQLVKNQREQCAQRVLTERKTCNVLLRAHQTQFDTMRRKCREATDLASNPIRLADAINARLERLRLRRDGGDESSSSP